MGVAYYRINYLSLLSYQTNLIKINIHNAIWSHTIYKSQGVHYKIAQSFITYDMSYRIAIPYAHN